ncbi:GNAT family N-acetyltransferase [Candidatus Bathyarchaeota archaeon]|nr:GNAT family N-acetyltransferase [Candidatus Bathyarchaeota archaeon]
MEIVPLNPAFEPIFWKHVNQDIPHYFFFAFDWKNNKDETDILLALTGRRIDGMMLVYKKRIVQFRGNHEATRVLLEHLDLEKVELQAPKEHKQYVLEKYESTWSQELMLMVLHEGGERLHTSYPIVKLDASDAEQIAAIMKKADPGFWGEITTDQVTEGMSSVNWVGIKVDGELASICRTRLAEGVGHIVTVATREAHRNKGYATSLVSHAVKSILKKTSIAIIYVLSDNQPATRVYKKVGFKPYKTYFFMKGKKR